MSAPCSNICVTCTTICVTYTDICVTYTNICVTCTNICLALICFYGITNTVKILFQIVFQEKYPVVTSTSLISPFLHHGKNRSCMKVMKWSSRWKKGKKANLKMGVSTKQSTYVCVSGGKKCSFFGKFDVLCFYETPVLRFALLPYYREVYLDSLVLVIVPVNPLLKNEIFR